MRSAATTAGMLSAVMLLAPGCDQRPVAKAASREEPVRRAVYRSLLARQLLATCPTGGVPGAEQARFEELKRLALDRGAGHAIWLGQNDFASVRRFTPDERCAPGEKAFRAALAGYSGALDVMARRVAEYRQ